ncbi:hypothetical protein FGO68_gene8171 [Halteria grandinella]|uniref:Uncharacterized protein n=1 Tax=Halteria grandinella TaxID=5974 RepID=A0A8J8P9B4_HALGN|nr:hypothetical protein FGO68_gene8171 [Halteria grandinella]
MLFVKVQDDYRISPTKRILLPGNSSSENDVTIDNEEEEEVKSDELVHPQDFNWEVLEHKHQSFNKSVFRGARSKLEAANALRAKQNQSEGTDNIFSVILPLNMQQQLSKNGRRLLKANSAESAGDNLALHLTDDEDVSSRDK